MLSGPKMLLMRTIARFSKCNTNNKIAIILLKESIFVDLHLFGTSVDT